MVIPRSPEPEMLPPADHHEHEVDEMIDNDSLDFLSPEEQTIYKVLRAKMVCDTSG